jgi:O-antigen ligase
LSRYWFRSHTHSLLLQIWVETGVFGVIAAGAFFFVPLWTAARGLGRCAAEWRGVIAGAMAGVLGLLAHDLVHFFLRQPADGIVTGVLLGIAASAPRRCAPGGATAGEPAAGDGG